MKSSKAFTLIELLISISLLSIVLYIVISVTLSSIKTLSMVADSAASLQVVRSVASRISADIMGSSGAGSSSSSGKIVLGDISYEFKDNKVKRQQGSDIYYMTTEGEIKDLMFEYPSVRKVNIIITAKTGKEMQIEVYARN